MERMAVIVIEGARMKPINRAHETVLRQAIGEPFFDRADLLYVKAVMRGAGYRVDLATVDERRAHDMLTHPL